MKTLQDCIDGALAVLDPEVNHRFASNPLATMRTDLGLLVEAAPHLSERRNDGGACDGMSFAKDGVVLYAPTPFSRRENFTLAHELGHWLVDQTPAVFDWLFEQPDPGRALETVCDGAAQRLLLSEHQVTAVLGQSPVQARHVLDLYEHSNASVPVCAIALASRLPGVGAIVIVARDAIEETATVEYASVHPDAVQGWPKVYPWPGQNVPVGHPLQFMAEGSSVRRRSFWASPWNERAEFYLDAVAVRNRCVAVLADTDLWGAERFHPDTPRAFDERPEREITCCGQTSKVRGYPCPKCGEVPCPACGKCRCDRQDDALVLCAGGCFLKYRPNLLVNGLCEDCR